MPRIDNPWQPTAVYRAYDSSCGLLYVGMTTHVKARMRHHRAWAAWWPDVTDVSVKWQPDWWAAEAVEAAAIMSERPRHNKGCRFFRRPDLTGRAFPDRHPVAAIPAPAHVAEALSAPPGAMAVRHRSSRDGDGNSAALSTAWTIPQAWNPERVTEFSRSRLRVAADEEAVLLGVVADSPLLVKEAACSVPHDHVWFLEEVEPTSGPGWDLAASVSARPA